MSSAVFKSEQIIENYINKNTHINKPEQKGGFKVWYSGGLLDNKEYYKFADHPVGLYQLFRNNEIRGNMKSPLYKRVYKEYFEVGHIVCALSFSQIESKTGWYRSRISRYIDKLVEWRWIRVDKIDVGKKKKQNIYLLGRINIMGDDSYYMDEIINSSQK